MGNNANERILTTHESYGTIQFSKAQGSARTLFGSSIKHNNIISCRISNGELQRYLNKDWIHPISTILEFEMSHTQFAEMLTNMNGTGVPITFLNDYYKSHFVQHNLLTWANRLLHIFYTSLPIDDLKVANELKGKFELTDDDIKLITHLKK